MSEKTEQDRASKTVNRTLKRAVVMSPEEKERDRLRTERDFNVIKEGFEQIKSTLENLPAHNQFILIPNVFIPSPQGDVDEEQDMYPNLVVNIGSIDFLAPTNDGGSHIVLRSGMQVITLTSPTEIMDKVMDLADVTAVEREEETNDA